MVSYWKLNIGVGLQLSNRSPWSNSSKKGFDSLPVRLMLTLNIHHYLLTVVISHSLMQPKKDSSYRFGHKKFGVRIRLFELVCIVKSSWKWKKKTKNKTHLLKKSIFFQTKTKSEHKRPNCLQYFLVFVMLHWLDTFISLPKLSIRPC